MSAAQAFRWAGLGVVGLAAVFPILVGRHEYLLYLGTMALLHGLLAQSWSLTAQAGLISFGHAAFFGVGAYASALLSLRCELSPWIALGLAALLAGATGVTAVEVAGDLRGPYFSLATLALSEILHVVALHWTSLTEGAWGLVGVPSLPWISAGRTRTPDYYVALILLGALCGTSAWIRRAPLGLALRAIRQGECRAAASGVDPRRAKRIAFAVSGLFAGAAGALQAHIFHWVDPASAFSPTRSVLPLVMTMFGGADYLAGPLLGAGFLYLGNELILQRLVPVGHLWLYGATLVVVVLLLPDGILGWIHVRMRARRDAL